jgi:hypothetical protein
MEGEEGPRQRRTSRDLSLLQLFPGTVAHEQIDDEAYGDPEQEIVRRRRPLL